MRDNIDIMLFPCERTLHIAQDLGLHKVFTHEKTYLFTWIPLCNILAIYHISMIIITRDYHTQPLTVSAFCAFVVKSLTVIGLNVVEFGLLYATRQFTFYQMNLYIFLKSDISMKDEHFCSDIFV